ncbi:YdcF family protein [Massilia sp. TSP1-1-2]|uniref:YdcF family protein n=1 Tax=unclassified Massilia TaxID=2609279 RepID=UPI003CF9E005
MTPASLFRKAGLGVLGGAALLLLAGLGISAAGMADDLRPTDVGIVLGSKVELDGQPSARLAARLDRGANLYAQRVFAHLIVSGGTGVEGFDEAAVMRAYLLKKGVPASAILVDSAGNTTDASARNCARLMASHGFTSVTVVSQYFHVPRTRLALRRYNIARIGSAHAYFFELRDLYSIAREVAALPAYWLNSRHP